MAYIVFRSPVGYHLYDREKNKVIALRRDEYDAFSPQYAKEFPEERERVLKRFQSKGYCTKSSLEKIEHPIGSVLEAYLTQKASNLVLQVTQNCNLRCSYCVYSGNYYNRQHNHQRMDESTALCAVDFFMKRSAAVEKPIIGFYGGEPFLEFELIKKVVAYVEEKYPDRNCGFNLTTNMTLLNDEIIDFIVEKDFNIIISIDGPEKVQNFARKYANGKGSFSKVMENAQKLRARDPLAFTHFSTNTVVSPGADHEAIRNFFDTDETLGPIQSRMSIIADTDSKEEIQYGKDFYAVQHREIFKVFLSMLGEIDKDKTSSIYASYSEELLKTYSQLKLDGMHDVKSAHPGGPCIPGVKKLFVDVHGNFYPCEKITEQEDFQIGNLDTGFDMDRVLKFLNVGQCTEKECKNCWAFSWCTTCGVNMIREAKLSREKRLEKCKEVNMSALGALQDMVTMKYYGYDFEGERIR